MENDFQHFPSFNISESSQSSKIVERVMTKLKNSQAQIIANFCEKKKEVSKEITKEIEEKSEQVKKNLKKYEKNMEDILFGAYEKISHEELNMSNIRCEYFECLYERIILNSNQRKEIIDEYYKELVELEQKRSKEFAGILKNTYNELRKLSFRVPRETEILVEKQIEEINQIILNNNRHFLDLKNDLELQTNNDSKHFLEELRNLKLAWARNLRAQTNKSVQYVQGRLRELTSDDIKLEQEKMKENCFEFHKKFDSMNIIVIGFDDVEKWLKWVQTKMATIDKSAQKIMSSFKQAAIAIFDRFFEEMKNIREQIIEVCKQDQTSQSDIEMYTPTLQDIMDQYDVEIEKLQNLWTDEVLEMEKVVNINYLFLMASATLWENHFYRTENLKLLVMLDVENCITNNNVSAGNFFGKMNILIDTLRQESTKERMDKCLEMIYKFLYSMEEVYNSQNTLECNIIKKYKQFLTMEIDVLMVEIKRFLETYPPDFSKDPKIQRRRASQTSEQDDPNEGLLPNQLIYCKFQVDAIKNWQFGVWEAISQYANVARQELLVEADEWIKYKSLIIQKRFELRLFFHNLRFLRVKETTYAQRIDELCCHQRRMEEHKLALDIALKSIDESVLKSEELYNKILEKYFEDTKRIEDKMIHFQNTSFAKANFHILKCKFTSASEKIEEIHCNKQKDLDDFIDKVKVSGVKYVKEMRTFTEGGNFSIPEIKIYTKELNKLQVMCEKKLAVFFKKLSAFKEKSQETMTNRHNELIAMLTRVKDELNFIEKKDTQLKLFEKDLKKEICSTKKTFDEFKNQFENVFVYETTTVCGDYKFFDKDAQKFQDYTNDLITFGNFLMHPIPIKLYSVIPNCNIVQTTEQQSQNVDLAKLNGKDVKIKKDDSPDKNHHKIISFMNTIDPPENLFLSKLMDILKRHWTSIHQTTKNFYQEHTNFFLDSQIPETLDLFAEDLSQVFIHHMQQCEIIWLETTQNFLLLLRNLNSYFSEYFDIFSAAFSMLNLKRFGEHFKTILADIDTEKMRIQKIYRDLQNKLLPLHGHPKNAALLEKLQEMQNDVQLKVDEEIVDSLRPFLDSLSNYYQSTLQEFTSMKSEIPELIAKVNAMVDIENILEIEFLQKLSLFKEYVENLKKTDCDAVLQKGIYENETESDFASDLKQNYAKYMRNIQSHDMKKLHESLKQEWDLAVKTVLDLYCVKYDQADLNI